ncbi:MAG: response regulator [Bacteroidales bacterium]|nr:response regulator [Bacteroidales bacterium]
MIRRIIKSHLILATYIIFFSFSAGVVNILKAQPSSFKFEYITPNEGLSQASVMHILKDEVGFMWFGTRNGLNRYDGYSFIKYYHNPEDTTSIAGDLIESTYIDSENNLWIGTNDGFCIYDRQIDAFKNFKYKKNYPEVLKGNSISNIFEDSKGLYWLSTYNDGIAVYNPEKDEYTLYSSDEYDSTSLNHYSIHATIEDNDGNIWIATAGGGLNLYHREKEEFTHYIHDENDAHSISNDFIWSVAKDEKGTVWLGTLGGGLCRLNKSENGEFYFDTFIPETEDIRRLKILKLYANRKGGIWIGTENGGLDYFNIETKKFTNYKSDENLLFSLNSNSIQSIYEDDIGNIWVGTYTGGVNVNKKNRKKIEIIRKIPGNENSLSNNAVTCFYEDFEKNLWIGTDGGGLNIWDRQKNRFRHYTLENSSLLSDAVLTICPDSYGNVWLGGWECGLNLYNRKTRKFINLSAAKYNFPNNNIFAVHADSEGLLWIAFGGGGLGKFDYKNNNLVLYTDRNSDLPITWLFDIDEDKYGNIIIGHSRGISFFDPVKEIFTNYSHNENDTNSLSHDQINTLLVAKDSVIWIGTNSGLNRLDQKTGIFKKYYMQDGLPNNSIAGLVEDRHNNLWISTNDGISKFNVKTKTFRNYALSDGLQGKGFIRLSSYETSNGEILFGGTDGFNVFDPDSLFENPIHPSVVINKFSIFNKPVVIGAKGSPIKKHINECDEIRLSYKQSVISFEYAALDFTAPDQNIYKYMLEGFDKDWNEVGNQRIATYTNLDPGEYILKINASNNDGVWSKDVKTLKIIIEPPFWKTFWFQLAILAVVIGLIVMIIRFRTMRLKKVNEYLETKVRERTSKLNKYTSELEKSTKVLEEQREEINHQKEELTAQRDALKNTNQLLLEQREQILKQNKELDKHRNDLESLVEMRTSELEKALKKAEESDKLKSAFLTNMSHEIRTPMNAIIGFSSFLNDESLTDKERAEYVKIINRNGDSLLMLIDDIIDLSKIEANQMQLKPVTVNVLSMLNEILKNYNFKSEKRNIDLKLDANKITKDIIIQADDLRVKQVFNNLITNSFKFTQKGFIQFGVESINENITFYVRDTGIGIPKDAGEAIFERFMKFEASSNEIYRGTGLGLAICKSLVNLWGGKIKYESELDEGTTFYFTHPLISNIPKPKSIDKKIRSSGIPDLTGKSVLIAEDEEDNFHLLNTYLAHTNAKIVWKKNGKEVIDFMDSNTADIIFMDIKMPILNGINATLHIRKSKPDIPIIAQTAYTYENEIEEIKFAGVNDYLIKPIKRESFIQMIRKYIK